MLRHTTHVHVARRTRMAQVWPSKPRAFRDGGRAPRATQGGSSTHVATLERFWKARGATDAKLRQQLVEWWMERDARRRDATKEKTKTSEHRHDVDVLRGARIHPQFLSPEDAVHVSERLLRLHALLGGRNQTDVVWMVVREPRLLALESKRIVRRLVSMSTVCGKDVLPLVEKHPELLLEVELEPDSADPQALLDAWRQGVASVSDADWDDKFQQLVQYKARHGDCSVGCREGDDRTLLKWTRKQRKDRRSGWIDQDRKERLESLGFLWDEESSDWEGWYNQLLRYHLENGDVDVKPYGSSEDSVLRHWLSVQRVSKRTGKLSMDRYQRLDALGVDWEGVDPIHA